MLKRNKKVLRARNPRKIITLIGICVLLANTLVLLITFIYAYIRGGKIYITIDSIGEANMELLLLIVTVILGLYILKVNLKQKK